MFYLDSTRLESFFFRCSSLLRQTFLCLGVDKNDRYIKSDMQASFAFYKILFKVLMKQNIFSTKITNITVEIRYSKI